MGMVYDIFIRAEEKKVKRKRKRRTIFTKRESKYLPSPPFSPMTPNPRYKAWRAKFKKTSKKRSARKLRKVM